MSDQPDPPDLPVVAIINTSPDVVDMLRLALERAGIVVVSAMTHEIRDGRVNFEAFLTQHQPRVIVYDIAPPYESNWQLFQHVSRMPHVAGRQIILTSTNAAQVEKITGHRRVYEVIGKPYDLDQIIQATREALHARPTE